MEKELKELEIFMNSDNYLKFFKKTITKLNYGEIDEETLPLSFYVSELNLSKLEVSDLEKIIDTKADKFISFFGSLMSYLYSRIDEVNEDNIFPEGEEPDEDDDASEILSSSIHKFFLIRFLILFYLVEINSKQLKPLVKSMWEKKKVDKELDIIIDLYKNS